MSLSTIRRYTEEDQARVQTAAESFCVRHGIAFDEGQAESDIDYAITDRWDGANLKKLWTACYCRALRVPCNARITTGYGYIGTRCE